MRAHAKVNLHLRVLGPRADGYHELRTIFQTLDLHDVITCRPRPGSGCEVTCSDPAVPCDRTNLVWRAADALSRRAGRGEPIPGVSIHIDKRIPLQAGLGGGSSDGAAALVALAQLWEIAPATRDWLAGIASELGADVPFFLYGGTALGEGKGEVLTPLPPFPPMAVVLVIPSFGVSTADAYRWHDAEGASRAAGGPVDRAADEDRAECVLPRQPDEWGPWLSRFRNDLEGPVSRRHPEIAAITGALRGLGAAHTAMTGSGSVVFGLFEREEAAVAARDRLSQDGWRTELTRTWNQ